MIVCFRFHRGGFDESMATKMEFPSIVRLLSYLSYCELHKPDEPKYRQEFTFQLYSFDDRLNEFVYSVIYDKTIIGFMWFEKEEDD